jgi:hypothetical protein
MCLRMETCSNGSFKMVQDFQVPETERTFLARSAKISLRLMDCAMALSSEKAYPNVTFIFWTPSFANVLVCPSTVCICIYFRDKTIYYFHLSCPSYYKILLKSFATYSKTLLTKVLRNKYVIFFPVRS